MVNKLLSHDTFIIKSQEFLSASYSCTHALVHTNKQMVCVQGQ